MACPGGCLNGGGQIKPKDKDMKPKELISYLQEIMTNPKFIELRNPEDNIAAQLIKKLVNENIGKNLNFHTSYKAVEKNIVSMSSLKW